MRDVAGSFARAELYLSIAALFGALACTGVVTGTGADDMGPGPNPGPNAVPTNPGRGEMHRLNATEYNNTVADVLGTSLRPANANWRGGEIEGFDNVASVLGVDDAQYTLYLDAAEVLANDVFASPALQAKFVTCATMDDACVQDIIAKIGLHVFRRPLRTAEIATYKKVYAAAQGQGLDHANAVKTLLWSLLSSAEFLYRIELPK